MDTLLPGGAVLIIRDYGSAGTRTDEDTGYLLRDHLGSLTTVLDKPGKCQALE